MSISDRLDQIEARRAQANSSLAARHMLTGKDAPDLVAALRAVLDVCEGLEEAHRANPTQVYEYGMEEAAHQVRNAIAAAFGCGDGIDTTPERVHETPNREHVGMEHAIEQVAKRLHSSYCECEGWHTECQGPQVGDRRVARRLAAEGLIAPAPLREEWGVQWDDHDIWGDMYNTRHEAETGAGDEGTPVHRFVTAWEKA